MRAQVVAPCDLDVDYSRQVRLGVWLLIVGAGGFVAWAALAPLDEGVPAIGTVAVESKHKRIDHLSGGIIEKLLVREGERVRAGQELVVFNEVQAKAALDATLSEWRTSLATESRLKAERDGRNSIDLPTELTVLRDDPAVATLIRGQNDLLKSRRAALAGELRIIRESIVGLESQLTNLNQLSVGRRRQVELFEEQLKSYRNLNRQGFVSRNQLLDQERQLAELQSKQSEDAANTAGVNARLADFRLRGSQREAEYRREVETQLSDVQKQLGILNERLTAQKDTRERLVVRAPVSGTVVDLAFHTIGGTVKPGERIADIVPDEEPLMIEAQLMPQYIDRVTAGMTANVHFDAYTTRIQSPVVVGEVVNVTADALTDSRSGGRFYGVFVRIPRSELSKLGPLRLQAGMQASVMFKTGERSLLAYLWRPFERRLSSALKEG